MSSSLVIIPTYNEAENIEDIIGSVLKQTGGFHLLVIDDGSPDGTADLVRTWAAKFPDRVFLEERTEKSGLGTAYIHGFRWALKRDYDYIFEMDADFSHNPDDLPRLLKACTDGKTDVAIGSRYVKGGKVEDWPLGRILISYFASVFVRLVTWMPVMDTTAGFICYRNRVLKSINLDLIHFIGYAFQIEMKYASHKLGYSLTEVPITFIDRQKGKSKMSMKIFEEAFWGVLNMRLRSARRYQNVQSI